MQPAFDCMDYARTTEMPSGALPLLYDRQTGSRTCKEADRNYRVSDPEACEPKIRPLNKAFQRDVIARGTPTA